jgi:NADH dehydrogenase FAD-containing subunit
MASTLAEMSRMALAHDFRHMDPTSARILLFGKIMVGPDLSVPGRREVFAIGDTAHVVAPVRNLSGIKSKTPMVMPGVAQPAIQEGKYVAEVIRRRVESRGEPEPFWYRDKGDLAIVGRTCAVADLRFAKFVTKRRGVRVLPIEPPSEQRFVDPAA